MYNFAGECFLNVTRGIKEFDTHKVIGLFPTTSDDLDFEWHLQDILLDDPDITALSDGAYNIFFMGSYRWEGSYSYDTGSTDYGVEITEFDIQIFPYSAKSQEIK